LNFSNKSYSLFNYIKVKKVNTNKIALIYKQSQATFIAKSIAIRIVRIDKD